MLTLIKNFFASVAHSRQGILVPEELYRSILTALGSGSFLGIMLTVLQAVLANVGTIFPNPIIGALATMTLTLIGDLVRRINQPSKPAPVPAPVVPPAPAA